MSKMICKQLCLVLAFGISFSIAACGGSEPQEPVVEEGKAETLPEQVQISMEVDPDNSGVILHDQTADLKWHIYQEGSRMVIEIPEVAYFELDDGEPVEDEITDGKRFKTAVLNLAAFYQAQGPALDEEDPQSESERMTQEAEDFARRVSDGINPTTKEFLQSTQGRQLIHYTITGIAASVLWTVAILGATTVEFVVSIGSVLESIYGFTILNSFIIAVAAGCTSLGGKILGYDINARDQALVLADCDLQDCDYSGMDALFEIMM